MVKRLRCIAARLRWAFERVPRGWECDEIFDDPLRWN
jgi:hypothetical protein